MPYRATLSQIGHAKSLKKTPQEMYSESADPRVTRVAAVYEEYEKALRQANALDFDDLLLESVRLLFHDQDIAGRLESPLELHHDRRIPGHQPQPV